MCLFFNLTQQKERALLREPIVKLLHLTDKALIQPVAKKETNNNNKKKDSHAFLPHYINALPRLISQVLKKWGAASLIILKYCYGTYLITGRYNEFSHQKNGGFHAFEGLFIINSYILMIDVSITQKSRGSIQKCLRLNDWNNS